MSFKKIPKEKWMQLSQIERDYYNLEYQKAFERNRRLTVILTRSVALFCVLALFFIGFVQLNALKEYGQIKDKYGDQAFCYLCGLESLKKCECEYKSGLYDYDNYKMRENYSIELAEYNIQTCERNKVIGTQSKDIKIES